MERKHVAGIFRRRIRERLQIVESDFEQRADSSSVFGVALNVFSAARKSVSSLASRSATEALRGRLR